MGAACFEDAYQACPNDVTVASECVGCGLFWATALGEASFRKLALTLRRLPIRRAGSHNHPTGSHKQTTPKFHPKASYSKVNLLGEAFG